MAITTQDIHEAANSLVEEGKKPTLAAIRKALGGGSFTTISEAMKEWKAENQDSQAETKEVVPEVITEKLETLISKIWNVALSVANSRLESEREALKQSQQKLEEERNEAIELADALNDEIEELKAELERKSELEEKIKQFDIQIHKLQISLDAAAKSNDELKEEVKNLRQANEEKTLELGKMAAIIEKK